ncbi:MAG: glycoside hydrolase family 2, partial [Tannerella sp.]|nr:glycoside hydrolase family 2 [Tannerella sp.]
MKKVNKLLFTGIIILFALESYQNLYASGNKVLFNKDWKFHQGSVANAEQPSYNDSRWRVLDLPHDWSVEPLPVQREGITVGPFSRMSEGGWDVGQTI